MTTGHQSIRESSGRDLAAIAPVAVDTGYPIRHLTSCTDYHNLAIDLPPRMNAAQFSRLKHALMRLGLCSPERMGVVYVRGPWGFLVIPGLGFPELRISFYFDTPERDREAVLLHILKLFVNIPSTTAAPPQSSGTRS